MIDEETEPGLVANSSTSSSLSRLSSESLEIDQINGLDSNFSNRLRSVSMLNINCTPKPKQNASKPIKYVSHYNVNKISKKQRKKYDHVQSKVKQYISDIKSEQLEYKKKVEEEKVKRERRMEAICNQIKTEKYTQSEMCKHQINSSLKELSEQCGETLEKMDVLNLEISVVRNDSFKYNSHTPHLLRTNHKFLFANSPGISNTPGMSPIDINSTCVTEDIEDSISSVDVIHNDSIRKPNPFIIGNSSGEGSVHSCAPLLREIPETQNESNKCSTKLYKLFCPGFGCFRSRRLTRVVARFKKKSNRVQPMTEACRPMLLVSQASPSQDNTECDSGHHSGGQDGVDWNQLINADLIRLLEDEVNELSRVTDRVKKHLQQLKSLHSIE